MEESRELPKVFSKKQTRELAFSLGALGLLRRTGLCQGEALSTALPTDRQHLSGCVGLRTGAASGLTGRGVGRPREDQKEAKGGGCFQAAGHRPSLIQRRQGLRQFWAPSRGWLAQTATPFPDCSGMGLPRFQTRPAPRGLSHGADCFISLLAQRR